MVFSNVGRVGGTNIDLQITNPGRGYMRANRHYRWRRRSGVWFARRYNRAYRGCGMMGSLRAGTHQFRFTFVRAGTNSRVRIPYLPWTMYDLDGGKEYPSTRDAVGIMTFNPTGIRAYCSGGVCRANAARREYPFPRNFDRLNRRSKMAAVTFLFRNRASFLMSYRTTYPHRVFIFKGSLTAMKPRARLPSRVGKPRRSSPRRRSNRRKSYGRCGRGVMKRSGRGWKYTGKGTNLAAYFRRGTGTPLTFRGLRENNLIGGGRMVFSNVGRVGGTNIDLQITNPGRGYMRANRHYRWRRRSGVWFARRYNRAYRGCGMMGSLRAGTHQFRFTFVRAGTNSRVRIPYLPWTMYDLDGGKEYPSTRDAVGIMTFNPTGIRAYCSGGVCRANAARREYPFPRNFDRLNRRSKMAAVTFLFRNRASFLMSYRTTYPHRVFIFKGSLTALKPRARLPRSTCKRRGSSRRRAPRPSYRRRRAPRPTYRRRRAPRPTYRRRRAPRPSYRRRRSYRRRGRLTCSGMVHRPACHHNCRAPRNTIHRRRVRTCR